MRSANRGVTFSSEQVLRVNTTVIGTDANHQFMPVYLDWQDATSINAGRYVLVCPDGAVFTSSDGLTWTQTAAARFGLFSPLNSAAMVGSTLIMAQSQSENYSGTEDPYLGFGVIHISDDYGATIRSYVSPYNYVYALPSRLVYLNGNAKRMWNNVGGVFHNALLAHDHFAAWSTSQVLTATALPQTIGDIPAVTYA